MTSGKPKTVTLVGCGNLGSAMLRGWVGKNLNANYLVIKPNALPHDLQGNARIRHAVSPEGFPEMLGKSDVVVMAVKPQIMDNVASAIQPFVPQDALVLSVAAGRSIESFENIFGAQQPIVRSMPNLAASVQESMTVAVSNRHVQGDQQELANNLLSCIGKVHWTNDENLMHLATALVGSGPGFVAHVLEAFTSAAEEMGFAPEESAFLARQMLIGTAAYLKANPELTATEMRKKVTSPNGTTAAGLAVLMQKLPDLVARTLEAASNRSMELGGVKKNTDAATRLHTTAPTVK